VPLPDSLPPRIIKAWSAHHPIQGCAIGDGRSTLITFLTPFKLLLYTHKIVRPDDLGGHR